jgi:dTDP-4-dehydrorhamnose 3,5-epimerase
MKSIHSRFLLHPTLIEDLLVVERTRRGDNRGYLSRLFCVEELKEAGFQNSIVQINLTNTAKSGALRGMHFQLPPASEDKFVSCLRGSVFDVAVDLRSNSPTFLHWHGEILSANNMKSLFIPKGFAHGFQSLEDGCELLYLHTALYSPELEAGLNYADPALAISWPLPVTDISPRDLNHPHLPTDYNGIQA